jgi:hypothetical protein
MHTILDIKDYEDADTTSYQGGYRADKIIDILEDKQHQDDQPIILDGGGQNPIYPDGLRELLKDLYVPIGLFTQIKPCSTRSFSHDGTCITDGIFNELDTLTSVLYKSGGTVKRVADIPQKKTYRKHLNKK